MKYLARLEMSRENLIRIIPKFQRWQEALEKEPEKHVKSIFPPHTLSVGNEKGDVEVISIYESDNEEELIDYIINFFPEVKIEIIPLMDSAKIARALLKPRK